MILTPNNEYSAVLDACVIAPMPLCGLFLRCAEEPALFRALWTGETLLECHQLLCRAGYDRSLADARISTLREAFPECEVTPPDRIVNAFDVIPRQHDRHVVAGAVCHGAHVIVTQHREHFPGDVLTPLGLLVHSPDEFLLHQYHLNCERMLEVLEVQASLLRMPRKSLLAKLRPALPDFVALAETSAA